MGDIFSSSAYQTLQEASWPGDYDEDLPHQLGDDSYLLAFRALVGLTKKEMTSLFMQPTSFSQNTQGRD